MESLLYAEFVTELLDCVILEVAAFITGEHFRHDTKFQDPRVNATGGVSGGVTGTWIGIDESGESIHNCEHFSFALTRLKSDIIDVDNIAKSLTFLVDAGRNFVVSVPAFALSACNAAFDEGLNVGVFGRPPKVSKRPFCTFSTCVSELDMSTVDEVLYRIEGDEHFRSAVLTVMKKSGGVIDV